MNKYYLGVDLGSTTSKAIIIDGSDNIIGRGITNTRANYKIASEIAKQDAIYNARFYLLKELLKDDIIHRSEFKRYINDIESAFQYLQFKKRLDSLLEFMIKTASSYISCDPEIIFAHLNKIFLWLNQITKKDYLEGELGSKNQFFRDIVSERYHAEVKKLDSELFEPMMLIFDKSITPVENEMVTYDFKELILEAVDILNDKYKDLENNQDDNISVHFDAELNLLKGNYLKISDNLLEHIKSVADHEIHIANMIGTGYGRALLPFPESCIKSEILCHAFGAHAVFPDTRTVLDIGGQDTKAIQIDSNGLVTSFYMNDRCAAGCGRYLGYIADELGLSLNELGPLALEANKEVLICSTCTVFAGAELRELLNVGEKREDILAGLHKAIVLRAVSLLARSGGVRNEFTFTGGVARNTAVLKYVIELVKKNYGNDLAINIHTDSIFMGALGAAMFARRNNLDIELPTGRISKKIA